MIPAARTRRRILGRAALRAEARAFLAKARRTHPEVARHSVRVARLSSRVAAALSEDRTAAYYAAVLHDEAKTALPPELFSGRNVTDAEYRRIRRHARAGHRTLRPRFLVTSLVAGLHHAVGVDGYGLSHADIPAAIGPGTAAKILRIAVIVSVCDFADAFTTRRTTRRDGPETDLESALSAKYPHAADVREAVLRALGRH